MVVPAGQVVPPGDHVVPRNRTVDHCWKSLLQEFRRRGLTEAEFCRRISLHSFRKHRYPPRPSQATPSEDRPFAGAGPQFVPVTILPDPPLSSITAPHPTSNSSSPTVNAL